MKSINFKEFSLILGWNPDAIVFYRDGVSELSIFAAYMYYRCLCTVEFEGVANVGTRPTIDGGSKVILETYLFDFDKEIYGRYVEVHFKQKIRDETRFQSLEQLKAQIKKDVTEAKKIFAEIKK